MSNLKFNFDYIKNRKTYFIISSILVIFCILSTFIFGANLDIQFKGGTLITYLYEGDIDTAAFKTDAETALEGIAVKITTGTDFSTGKNNIQLSLLSNSGLTADKQIVLTNALEEKYAVNGLVLAESTDVSPSAGKEFFSKCIVASVFSAIVLIIYIAVRFKNIGGWLAGLCAIIALLHDIIIVYGTFVVFGMDIDANFMAVILTILGYSVNDTIVIYDRIRENQKIYKGKMSLAELTNLSTNQSFTRSINTSVTTIAAMLVVTIVAMVYGVQSILSFSLPMMVGLISGTYSTICIAGPLWVYLEERKSNKNNDGAKKQNKAAEV
ncbi:MAG: protein translocase subunit SecF [Oscillospiraceae bacterium]|nr:protein translocase subunit SecF [Oscillospiraceae bacterium]